MYTKVKQFWYFWHFFNNFQKHFLLPKWPYQWSGAVVQCSCRRISMRIFSMFKKTLIFIIFNDFNNFLVLGPRPLGPMGPSIFLDFLNFCFMVWDLSRSVPRLFRSPGNPLINLFHVLFNSKCHFFKVIFFI